MSADRWNICPKCQAAHTKVQVDAAVKLRESYGKIPVEEYLAIKKEVENPSPLEETLREDYEFWLDLDAQVLNISYRARCQVCAFDITYKRAQSYQI